MASDNTLQEHFIVDAITIRVGLALNHPKRDVLLRHFTDGRAHLCSHTWGELERAQVVDGKLDKKIGNLIPDDPQVWDLTSGFLSGLKLPGFVATGMVEPKLRIAATARILGYSIVTEDSTSAYCLQKLCTKLGLPCFCLDDI